MVAFNKHIANELTPKLKTAGVYNRTNPSTGKRLVTAQTIHGLGYKTLINHLAHRVGSNKQRLAFRADNDSDTATTANKLNLVEEKYDKLVSAYLFDHAIHNVRDYEGPVTELIRLTQLTLTNPADKKAMLELVKHYGLTDVMPVWETALKMVGVILERGQELAESQLIINFDDMLFLPNVWNLQPETFDWVLVDEVQDLSRAQLELVLRCRKPQSGRFLFVGDEHQSIFGFTAADTHTKELILERTGATELPLSICYRCPTSHVELAATIYPGIEAALDASEGVLRDSNVSEDDLAEQVKPGDLVICRTTAPLISVCFRLIREGIKAKVRGRDIGRSIKAIVTALEKDLMRNGVREPATTFDLGGFDLLNWLGLYKESQLERAMRLGATELNLDSIRDKIETLAAIYESASPKPKTPAELKRLIGELFSDEVGSVWFSSVHRAKGLEADNVWILRPDLMPHPMAKLAWEREQERNCQYVAYTRAKRALFIIQPAKSNPTDNDEESL